MIEVGLNDYLFVREVKHGKKYRGIYRNCNQCKQLYFTPIFELKRGGGKFCSRKCNGIAATTKVDCICGICKKEFKLSLSRFKNGEGKYCSNTCAGIAQSGNKNHQWNGGKIKCICEFCYKEFESIPSRIKKGEKYCSKKCSDNASKTSIKCICKICKTEFERSPSKIKLNGDKYCSHKCLGIAQSGKGGSNWKGGVTPLKIIFRTSKEYADWRISCMARDKFTCQTCGKKGGMLNVHHIKTVKDIFKEYDIKTRSDFINCDELWDMDNGITLCIDCHKEIHRSKACNIVINS